MPDRIVLLSDHSLLSDGVISQLKQHRSTFQFVTIDVMAPDLLLRIIEQQPSILVLDGSNPVISQSHLLLNIFNVFPSLQVVYLDTKSDEVKVIYWGSRQVSCIDDLISVLMPGAEVNFSSSITMTDNDIRPTP